MKKDRQTAASTVACQKIAASRGRGGRVTDVISQVQLHILACVWKKAIYLEFGVSYILHGKRFGASSCFAIPISDIIRNQWFLLKPW